MRRVPTIFDWHQEPAIARWERASRGAGGVDSPTAPEFKKSAVPAAVWEQLRDAPTERDRTLSPLGVEWRASFPGALAPVELCERYPRVANRLALTWKDPVLSALVLDSLLQDRRGGRQGFPTRVAAELRTLRREVARGAGS